MQEPGDLLVPPVSQVPRRRQRQERTVYSALERLELERTFEMNKYPTYQELQALADRLHLKERQVQVWFKNRRAKLSRQQLQQLRGWSGRRGSKGRTAPTCPRVPAAPAAASGGPVFPGGPGLCRPPPPSPLGVFPAAQPTCSSYDQAWGPPGYGAPEGVPAVPAPAPAWPQGASAFDFSPDTPLSPDFPEVRWPPDRFTEASVSPATSGYQEGAGFVREEYSGPGCY